MQLEVGEALPGTSEADWMACTDLTAAPTIALRVHGRVVVVAPHPDDEVLAAGGTMRRLARRGNAIVIVAVTDGEASHPRSATVSRAELSKRRAAERAVALHRLGLGASCVHRLGCSDGGVARERGLVERLATLLRGAAVCLAPWEHDGHPDHDATGRAVGVACERAGVRRMSYPVWAWHWATPGSSGIPWERVRRVALGAQDLAAKAAAIRAFRSQIHPLSPERGDGTVLPPSVLTRFRRPFETFFV
jgi:LmbE family N-acetylglucosaminyl deacetylase